MNKAVLMPPDADQRLPVLDGLRAMAIFLVLARHSLRPFWPDMSVPFLKIGPIDLGGFFLNGWIGVDLFFVLSGFLITTHLSQGYAQSGSPIDLKRYFRRRFMRIAPAYYVVLTIVCTGIFLPAMPFHPQTVWGWRYVYHLLFLNDYWPSDICVVFWSLAIEAKFYLIAPFLIRGVQNMRGAFAPYRVLAMIIACALVLRVLTMLHYGAMLDGYDSYFALMRNRFHLSLDGLLAGAAAALAWRNHALRGFLAQPRRAALLFAGGCAVILALMLPAPLLDSGVGTFDKVFLPTTLALAFTSIMLGALAQGRGSAWLAAPAFKFWARISYSFYLVHLPLLMPLAAMLSPPANASGWLGFLCLYIPVCAGVALALHYAIEKPGIRWAHKY